MTNGLRRRRLDQYHQVRDRGSWTYLGTGNELVRHFHELGGNARGRGQSISQNCGLRNGRELVHECGSVELVPGSWCSSDVRVIRSGAHRNCNLLDATYIWAVEANTSDNGSTEGDGVYIRKRRRSDAIVYGYGLTAYAEGIYTADPAKNGVSGYIYQAAHAGPGPAELTAGVVAAQNLVADTLSVTGPIHSGRNFIQQNDGNTVALEVVGFAGTAPQLVLVKDPDGVVRFEISAAGSTFSQAVQIGSATADVGGGVGVLGLKNAATVPTTNPSGGGVLYPENGALKWRGPNGTVTTIAPA